MAMAGRGSHLGVAGPVIMVGRGVVVVLVMVRHLHLARRRSGCGRHARHRRGHAPPDGEQHRKQDEQPDAQDFHSGRG